MARAEEQTNPENQAREIEANKQQQRLQKLSERKKPLKPESFFSGGKDLAKDYIKREIWLVIWGAISSILLPILGYLAIGVLVAVVVFLVIDSLGFFTKLVLGLFL